MRNTVIGLVRACHPEPTIAVTVGVCAVTLAAGGTPAVVPRVAAAVLASQLAVGWTNDALDAGRDAAVGRRDKPIPAGQVSRVTVGAAAAVAAVATVPLALLSGPRAAAAAALGLVMGLLYDWPLKSTVFSVVPYLVAFGSIMAFAVLALPGSPAPPWWLVAAGALLGGGAHFVNVLPDLADDARTGVQGLPHRLGRTGSWLAACALLGGATLALALGPPGPASWPSVGILVVTVVLLGLGWWWSRRPGSRAAFRAVLLVAIADVALLLLSSSAL